MSQAEDEARERRISELHLALLWAIDKTKQTEFLRRLEAEIKSRSPAQVRRMEIEKGLR